MPATPIGLRDFADSQGGSKRRNFCGRVGFAGVYMTVRVVRLGTARAPGEGLRVGTVRHPPRGVRKGELSTRNFYDVWFPNLAPSAALVKLALGADAPRAWSSFARRYRREMAAPEVSRTLDLLAALSHQARFSVGCYCADESRCHRSILRELLAERGAEVES